MSGLFDTSPAPTAEKLDNFPNYVRRQALSRFLARYELFKLQLHLVGSIVECGVHRGSGVATWAKLSAALEPYAIHRRIYGFDTFQGFPSVAGQDRPTEHNPSSTAGGLDAGAWAYEELERVLNEHDHNRYLSEFKKVFLIQGDAVVTIPAFVQENQHVLVSMMFMDFDVYEPTRVALEHFVPRMCRGAVLAFDELNNPWWPGETLGLLDTLGVKNYRIERFLMDPNISYIVL